MIITSLGQRIVVRFARKPIWMPTAPSKLFRIPEHTFYTSDEIELIYKLDVTHKHQHRSIQEFMRQEFYLPSLQAGGLPVEFIEQEEKRDQELLEENDKENERIGNLKKEMLDKMIQELETKVTEEKFLREEQLLKNAMEVDSYIEEAKADVFSFVTPDNIEQCIEKAIENPVGFEFCIDPAGRQYVK